ncbi:MAG TPA: hypothetical protein VNO30_01300 [Kofleriaceae bacterium]|nr:hypothetical protein [Kofleriaceae bacterium]
MADANRTRTLAGMLVAGLTGLAGLGACGGGGGGGGDDLLLSGTACGEPTSYRLSGDERIVVARRADGMLEALLVLDGQLFDTESDAAWAQYAAQHDTFFLLAFDDPEPATPHTVTRIFDSLFAGRGVGVLGFVEHGAGERVEIKSIDLAAPSIEVEFDIPVGGRVRDYPPTLASFEQCAPTRVIGSFGGPVELLAF